MTLLLVGLAVAFAFSMGAHYTGACMGMPHALGAVTARRALVIMAPLTLLGATFASHKVAHTVGYNLLGGAGLTVDGLVVVIAVAFGLTSLFNAVRVPTSTIQILVFSVVGAGLGAGVGVHWAVIATLAVVWILAPVAAAGLGFLLTRLLDLVPALREQSTRTSTGQPAGADALHLGATAAALGAGLVGVGALASFTMGSNDVANATGSLVGTGTLTPLLAGFVGGLGLAAGVLTWGRPLLRKVAFDLVAVDRPMAAAAQLVQAVVVLAAVGLGLFTSMNQALIGAMYGAGRARGQHTVNTRSLLGVLRGWVIGPGAAVTLSFALVWVVAALAGTGAVSSGG